MITPDIIEYITQSLAAGLDSEVIKTELRAKGLPNDEMDAAFIAAKTTHDETQEMMGSGLINKREVFIGIVALLIVGLALFIFLTTHKSPGQISELFK